ncbi:bifunctional transcriptional activator/DNA repair enzyme AdaA [Abyssalbus ytuae]|uniref:Methylated-DNA--protein-cysteine methyltransferase n=1 Tax=Abyssalbus ytuae TaxID=2926907 RepID=A0A9E6ZQG8_9FLAO|nr:bifunctional transcriptional activator/DNA repair protein Ada [Abyssalbus ytuae]UOB16033.1 methylated-DNA--[protein]-cysteine S-methyltransferase [Abyssalbus ytuae]
MLITDKNKIDLYYQALLDRKESFVGIFYVGVKTTSVFCIASCRARKPKKENIEFFTTLKDAIAHGYRPCKICKPTETVNETPAVVKKAVHLAGTQQKVSDSILKEHGISPETVRRWFKKHYGITFHTYQRMNRINNAFRELKKGKNATAAAFDSGYESLSGFGYTFKKIMGSSPQNSTGKNLILISRFKTVLGPMFVCATDKGVCLVEFADRRMLETEFHDLQKILKATIITGENEHITQARKEINQYFNGSRKTFEVSLHTPGTPFQNRVWNSLHSIPYGKTSSYQQQAVSLGNEKAVRAVAAANGKNRIAIIIPCHRVIGKNGEMTGYAGGLERKKWLLDHERKNG